MASRSFGINLVFACVVGLLATVASTSAYLKSGSHVSGKAAARDSQQAQLPENHPPLDLASRLTALERMSASQPQNADYQTQIGDTYYDLGKYEKAAAAYEKSLSLRPDDPNVETDLATCFYYLGQHDKALEILDRILKYSPNFPQAMFNKGIVLLTGKNNLKDAIAVWEALLRSNPTFARRQELEEEIRQLKASVR